MTRRFEVYPQQHKPSMDAVVAEETADFKGFGWRFRLHDQVVCYGGKGFKDRPEARGNIEAVRSSMVDGKRISYPPIVDVNESGDVI